MLYVFCFTLLFFRSLQPGHFMAWPESDAHCHPTPKIKDILWLKRTIAGGWVGEVEED